MFEFQIFSNTPIPVASAGDFLRDDPEARGENG
jgi:hypothetical protein